MDGRGRWIDNIFVERLWRSLKNEEVFLHAYDDTREANAGIGSYMKFFNTKRLHQSLGYKRPRPSIADKSAGLLSDWLGAWR